MELNTLFKRIASSNPQNLGPSDVQLLAENLIPTSSRSAQSLAFLTLSKYCEGLLQADKTDDEQTEPITSAFLPLLESTFAGYHEIEPESFIPFTSLLAALFPLAPLPAVRLLTTHLEPSPEPPPDPLAVLLEAAELPSRLQPVLAGLFAQAAGNQPGRDLVRSRAGEWLRSAVDFGDDNELSALCAVALSKLGREGSLPGQDQDATPADEALCRTLMGSIASSPASSTALLPSLEGLSILSIRPPIRELLAGSHTFLRSLLKLVPTVQLRGGSLPVTPRGSMDVDLRLFEPVETSLCYGVTTILVNLTSRKAAVSAEDLQLAKLRAMAISGKTIAQPQEDDPLESDQAVRERVKRVLKAGCVSALRGLARAESRLVKVGLGSLCLNLVEEKADRPAFVRDGGFKVLSEVVRNLTINPSATTKNPSATSDVTAVLPAVQALAKLVITIPPHLLFPPPHLTTSLNALTPLYSLLVQPSSTLLQQFESLMALTNLASVDPSISSRIVVASIVLPKTDSMWSSSGKDDEVKVLTKVEELMLDDNSMIRRAATQLVCNLASSPAGFSYFAGEVVQSSTARVKSRLNVLLVLTDVEDMPTRLASGGALAILTGSNTACEALLSDNDELVSSKRSVWSRVLRMLDPEGAAEEERHEDHGPISIISITLPNSDLAYRAVTILRNFITFCSSMEETRRGSEFSVAKEARMEERLLETLRSGVGEEVSQITVECLKLLKKS